MRGQFGQSGAELAHCEGVELTDWTADLVAIAIFELNVEQHVLLGTGSSCGHRFEPRAKPDSTHVPPDG